jgi:hypothetical protein
LRALLTGLNSCSSPQIRAPTFLGPTCQLHYEGLAGEEARDEGLAGRRTSPGRGALGLGGGTAGGEDLDGEGQAWP